MHRWQKRRTQQAFGLGHYKTAQNRVFSINTLRGSSVPWPSGVNEAFPAHCLRWCEPTQTAGRGRESTFSLAARTDVNMADDSRELTKTSEQQTHIETSPWGRNKRRLLLGGLSRELVLKAAGGSDQTLRMAWILPPKTFLVPHPKISLLSQMSHSLKGWGEGT